MTEKKLDLRVTEKKTKTNLSRGDGKKTKKREKIALGLTEKKTQKN